MTKNNTLALIENIKKQIKMTKEERRTKTKSLQIKGNMKEV